MENPNAQIIKISDTKTGDSVSGCLLVKQADILTTKTGSLYLKAILTDGHKAINWVVWDFSDKERYQPASIVFVSDGQIGDYNGSPQLKADPSFVKELQESDYATYGLSGTIDFTFHVMTPDSLRNKVISLIAQIKSPMLSELVRAMINSTNGEYYRHPAASGIHHAFVGGLAFHSVSMAELIIAQADVYAKMDSNRPDFKLNKDLLIAGALIHDIGKVYEMTPEPDTTYTKAGDLLGHVIIGNNILVKTAEKQGIKTGNEELMLLEHMVLSHHGQLAWGAPVQPKTLEAIMLHQADITDAHVETSIENLEDVPQGSFSQNKVFGLDNIKLYKPEG